MKLLVAGEVKGQLDVLFGRVGTLNASKAGPFDVLFCLGDFYPSGDSDATAFEDYLCGTKEVPIPTYFIEGPPTSAEAKYGTIQAGEELCANVKYLGSGGLELVGKLTVGFLGSKHTNEDLEKLLKPASSSTFLGSDIFLTTHWGQRVAAGYHLSHLFGDNRDVADLGDSTVADLAVVLRPRYHFAAKPNVFFRRAPYKNHATPPKTKLSHVTRFISLGEVSTTKDKNKKWLHAISIDAIPYMTLEDLVEEPSDITESPYQAFEASAKRGLASEGDDDQGALKKFRSGMSHQMAQQIQEEEEARRADSGMFFWGGSGGGGGREGGVGRGGRGGDRESRPPREVDPTNTTIFIGGLPPGFPVDKFESAFSHYGKIVNMRTPPGKDFAFIEFASHEEAKAAIESRGITLNAPGVKLAWSTSKPTDQRPPRDPSMMLRPGGGGGGGRGRGERRPPPGGVQPDDESQCWFCVGSSKAELELLITIGENLYMAVPKGPLTPEHVLLIPINHVPAMAKLSIAEWGEFEKFKNSVKEMYAAQKLRMIVFERRLETRGAKHTHVQIIPIPESKAADVRDALETNGKDLGVYFEGLPAGKSLPEMNLGDAQYLYFEIPGLGGHGVARLLHRLPPGGRLPMQFGRDAIAELLGMPEKTNWKECVLSKPDEEKMIDNLKARYTKYDWMEGAQ